MDAKRNTTGHLKKAFLAAFAETGVVLAAAQAAGVGRTSVYRWLEHDEAFSSAFHQAEEDSTQHLERVAYERATRAQEPSDTLLIFLLKARRPERYRDRFEVRHAGGTESRVRVEYADEAADVDTGYPTS